MKLQTYIVEEALALTDAGQSKASSRSKEGFFGKIRLRSCIQCQLILGYPGRHSILWNNSIESLNKYWRLDGYQDALVPVTASGTLRSNLQYLCLPSEWISSWMLQSASSVHIVWRMPRIKRLWGSLRKSRLNVPICQTCNHILEHLRTKDLDVFLMFPFTLTKRAAINNELLDSIMHDATKCIGPAAQAETLERNHWERWKEKECKWAAWLKKKS